MLYQDIELTAGAPLRSLDDAHSSPTAARQGIAHAVQTNPRLSLDRLSNLQIALFCLYASGSHRYRMSSLPKRVCGHSTPVFEMDAHLIAAFDESVSELSRRRERTESVAVHKEAPPLLTGSVPD
jgi:hypothetical protein